MRMGKSDKGNGFAGWWLRLGIYGGLLIMGIWFFNGLPGRMLYPVPSEPVAASAPDQVRELVWKSQSGRRIYGWFYPSPEGAGDLPVLLYFHGNAENLGTMWAGRVLQDLGMQGAHVLAVDYPGYGKSEGQPSEASILEAADLAMDWIVREFPGQPKIIGGWSLGAAVAVQTAGRHRDQVDGLILLSAWTSLEDVGACHFPRWLVRVLVRERYDSLAVVAGLDLPALVLHGSRDQIIPTDQGARLAGALAGSHWVALEGFGHNDLVLAAAFWMEIRDFLIQFQLPSP